MRGFHARLLSFGVEHSRAKSRQLCELCRRRGVVVRALVPGFKSSILPLDGFVLGGPELNSSTLCKQPNGQPPASWDF